NSYRGIALNSVVYKILTKMVSVRLREFTVNKIPGQQYGFMPGRSVFDAIESLLASVRNSLYNEKPQSGYAIYVDYTKAFDSVTRRLILEKVALLGATGPMVTLLKNILRNNLVRVDDGIQLSSEITQNQGLLQGDALSPFLFILLTAELPAFLMNTYPSVNICMYADDAVIWSTSRADLQGALDTLVNWSE